MMSNELEYVVYKEACFVAKFSYMGGGVIVADSSPV